MKILFLSEIIGRTGRNVVAKVLPGLKKKYEIDLCLANGETITHGKGITSDKIEEIIESGVDFLTTGNHFFHYRNFLEEINSSTLPVIRPANYADDLPGKGYDVLDLGRKGSVLIINLQGRVFMPHQINSPYEKVDSILDEYKDEKLSAILVDFHAEATSEKLCMGYYLDGRVSVMVGTHTHIATADARILPGGTGYVTDLGMIGSLNSILGGEISKIVPQQKLGILGEFDVETEPPYIFNSVIIEINRKKAISCERLDLVVETL